MLFERIARMLSKEEFKGVFDAHFDAVRNYVFYRCGDIEMASDVAQDVFMKVWEKRFSLDAGHLKPLLYRMANDCFISLYRKNACRMNFEQSLVPEYDSEPSPEDEISFRELANRYVKALELMPEKQRTVFLMSREDGMKYAEIAEYLHLSVKMVEKYMSASLQFLRTKLL
jgi:RNA polymerase sigma-70 factor (ECF subfamily)